MVHIHPKIFMQFHSLSFRKVTTALEKFQRRAAKIIQGFFSLQEGCLKRSTMIGMALSRIDED